MGCFLFFFPNNQHGMLLHHVTPCVRNTQNPIRPNNVAHAMQLGYIKEENKNKKVYKIRS